MNAIAQSVITLSGLAISEIVNKNQPMWLRYVCHFVIILGILSASKAYCLTPEASQEIFYELGAFDKKKTKNDYIKLRDAHHAQGVKCKAALQDVCWYLPNQSDRETAKWCLTTFAATIPCNTPQSRVLALILSAMTSYGLNCCDQWNTIQTLEHEAEYHFEMFEFYADLINNWKGK
jgi:hypothetical protein